MQKSETTTTPTKFIRRARVGMAILNLEVGVPVYVKFLEHFDFTKKDGDVIPAMKVVNLQTGEEMTMWLDGGLKGQFSQMGGFDKAVGQQFEIIRQKKKPVDLMIDGKLTTKDVNTYDVYNLDTSLDLE